MILYKNHCLHLRLYKILHRCSKMFKLFSIRFYWILLAYFFCLKMIAVKSPIPSQGKMDSSEVPDTCPTLEIRVPEPWAEVQSDLREPCRKSRGHNTGCVKNLKVVLQSSSMRDLKQLGMLTARKAKDNWIQMISIDFYHLLSTKHLS